MSASSRPWLLMSGTTRGVGRALASSVRARGYAVCALARPESVQAARDAADHCLTWDCGEPWERNDSQPLLEFVKNNRVVGFIHAAGVLGPMDGVPSVLDAVAWQRWWLDYERALRVNHLSGAALIRAVSAFLHPDNAQPHAVRPAFVMHLSSGAAVKPYAGWNAYCASKSAMLMEFRCLAAQTNPRDLLCLSVAPGTVMTDMMKQVLSADADSFPALPKFKELERSGGLVTPESAAEKISTWLMDTAVDQMLRWHGELYDVRSSS